MCLYPHESEESLFSADTQICPKVQVACKGEGYSLGVSIPKNIQQSWKTFMEVERLICEAPAGFQEEKEALSREGGLFPRNKESFPRDHPHRVQFPVGKYLKIGNYRI